MQFLHTTKCFCFLPGKISSEKPSSHIHPEAEKLSGPSSHPEGKFWFVCGTSCLTHRTMLSLAKFPLHEYRDMRGKKWGENCRLCPLSYMRLQKQLRGPYANTSSYYHHHIAAVYTITKQQHEIAMEEAGMAATFLFALWVYTVIVAMHERSFSCSSSALLL